MSSAKTLASPKIKNWSVRDESGDEAGDEADVIIEEPKKGRKKQTDDIVIIEDPKKGKKKPTDDIVIIEEPKKGKKRAVDESPNQMKKKKGNQTEDDDDVIVVTGDAKKRDRMESLREKAKDVQLPSGNAVVLNPRFLYVENGPLGITMCKKCQQFNSRRSTEDLGDDMVQIPMALCSICRVSTVLDPLLWFYTSARQKR